MLSAGLVSSLWIGLCAAAPEYIWQGLAIAFRHPSLNDLLEALLIGLILAFFVEPLITRAQGLAIRHRGDDVLQTQSHSALFAASLSLSFAVVAVCLHEAMSAFVSDLNSGQPANHSGLVAGLEITIGWGIVPFAVTAAWLGRRNRWFAIPIGLLAVASSFLAGWAFTWSARDVIDTTIPALFILAFGYRRVNADRGVYDFARFPRIVAVVGVLWLLCAFSIDSVMSLLNIGQFRLYDAGGYWTDARFYVGWSVGLLLAPPPNHERTVRDPAA